LRLRISVFLPLAPFCFALWRSEGSEMSLRAFYDISPSVAPARTGRKIDVVLLLPLRCVASV